MAEAAARDHRDADAGEAGGRGAGEAGGGEDGGDEERGFIADAAGGVLVNIKRCEGCGV